MSISAQGGLVIIDVSGCSSHQLSDSYQDFGLLCARRKVRWALLRTGDEDARVHYALGCDARVFRIERQAEQWLLANRRPAQPMVGEVAVA